MRVLVVNTGSSSLKLSVLDPDDDVVEQTSVQRFEGEQDLDFISSYLENAGTVEAVGHRVVHGGQRYTEAALVDAELIDYLGSLVPLAPLHNPRAIAGIRAAWQLLPDVPAVACFDTAFHATLPPAARTYALPRAWNERWNLRRYGFHGLSHAYATRRGAQIAGTDPQRPGRIVSCHLGSGASLAAVRDGICRDTTMGFTPMEGLVMRTRSGSVDPGLLLWLLEHGEMEPEDVGETLERRSGLSGLSGTSGDMRDIIAGSAAGNAPSRLALEVFNHVLCRAIAGMTAAIGGLDVLVMTGGIGEHAWQVRETVATRLPYLGIGLDAEANRRATADADISDRGSKARTVVVTAREDIEIATQVTHFLTGDPRAR